MPESEQQSEIYVGERHLLRTDYEMVGRKNVVFFGIDHSDLRPEFSEVAADFRRLLENSISDKKIIVLEGAPLSSKVFSEEGKKKMVQFLATHEAFSLDRLNSLPGIKKLLTQYEAKNPSSLEEWVDFWVNHDPGLFQMRLVEEAALKHGKTVAVFDPLSSVESPEELINNLDKFAQIQQKSPTNKARANFSNLAFLLSGLLTMAADAKIHFTKSQKLLSRRSMLALVAGYGTAKGIDYIINEIVKNTSNKPGFSGYGQINEYRDLCVARAVLAFVEELPEGQDMSSGDYLALFIGADHFGPMKQLLRDPESLKRKFLDSKHTHFGQNLPFKPKVFRSNDGRFVNDLETEQKLASAVSK